LSASFFSGAVLRPAGPRYSALRHRAGDPRRRLHDGLAPGQIDWKDPTEDAPAVVTVLGMPLTYSIATGIVLSLLTYIAMKLVSGGISQLSPAVLFIGAVFVLHFALG
jgi:hypothetical protein